MIIISHNKSFDQGHSDSTRFLISALADPIRFDIEAVGKSKN